MRIISYIILIYLSLPLSAQIISLEERRTKNPQKGLQGNINYSLAFTKNNKNIISNGARIKLQYNDSLNSYMLFSDLSLSQVDKEKNINKGAFGIMHNFAVPEKFMSAESIYQYEYDEIKKLKHRHILGGGPRFKIANSEKFKLSLVAYTIYLNELYEQADNIQNSKSLVKFSSKLSTSYQFTKQTSLTHSTYYEPDYSDPNDYRIWSESRFKMLIRKDLAFSLFFKVDYDSLTPQGVDNLYYTVNNSFTYSF